MSQEARMTRKQALAVLYQACDGLWFADIAQDEQQRMALAQQSLEALKVFTEMVYGKWNFRSGESLFLCKGCYRRRAQWLKEWCLLCEQAREAQEQVQRT